MEFPALNNVLQALSSIKVDPDDYVGQEIDDARVQFYVERARMLLDDGVPAGVNLYERKLLTDETCNPITKIAVLHEFFNLREEYKSL